MNAETAVNAEADVAVDLDHAVEVLEVPQAPADPARQAAVADALLQVLPARLRAVRAGGHRPYECDGLAAYRAAADGRRAARDRGAGRRRPAASAAHCACPSCRAAPAPACPAARMPIADGVVLSTAQAQPHRRASTPMRARPWCSRACATSRSPKPRRAHGLYYAPDPSSQIACTIGGNVAENSGGVHCLKYGLTVHNVLRVRMVDHRRRGGRVRRRARSTRRASTCWRVFIGSEGMLGGRHRSDRQADPEAAAARVIMASLRRRRERRRRGGRVIAAGIIPAGLEMMDRTGVAHGRAVRARPATTPTPPPSCCASPTARPRKSPRKSSAWRRCCRRSGATRIAVSQHGGGAAEVLVRPQERLSRRPAASRPTTTAWTAPFRASSWRRCCWASQQMESEVRPALRQRVPCRRRQPASADPVRRQRAGRIRTAPKRSAPRSWSCAWRSAAPSPASMASASRRSTRCACSSRRPERDAFFAVKRAFDPAGLLNPDKGIPTLHRCAEYGKHACAAAAQLPHPDCRASEGNQRPTGKLDPGIKRSPISATGLSTRRTPPRSAAAHPRRRQQGLVRPGAATATVLDTRAYTRHRRLRADRAGDHRALRHAAGRDRGGAGAARTRCWRSSRRTFGAPAPPSAAWSRARLSGPRRARRRRACATSCSARC